MSQFRVHVDDHRLLLGFGAKKVSPGALVYLHHAPIVDVRLWSLTPPEIGPSPGEPLYTVRMVTACGQILPLSDLKLPPDGMGAPRQYFFNGPRVNRNQAIQITIEVNHNVRKPLDVALGIWALIVNERKLEETR